MRSKRLSIKNCVVVISFLLLASVSAARGAQRDKAQLGTPADRDTRRMETLKQEIRRRLVTLPYYTVFDWLQAEAKPDGTVILSGQVARPTLKTDAEARVKKIESATQVINKIEVLPLS